MKNNLNTQHILTVEMDFSTLIETMYAMKRERDTVFPKDDSPDEIKKWNETTLDYFRNQLEPYVFQYLQHKYGSTFDAFWKTHTFPKKSKYALVIVERRCHPNWWFILRNIAWAAPYCSLYIFCSDLNIDVIRSYLGDKAENVNIIPWFQGNVSREEGKAQTNITFKLQHFYEIIDAEYMLRFEMDTYFLQKVPTDIFAGDFYGAPWGWAQDKPGGGGLTVRNIAAMIDICNKEKENINPHGEDDWIGHAIVKHGYSVPSFDFRRQIFLENMLSYVHPIGIHQFWTFINNFGIENRQEFKKNIKALLTLQNKNYINIKDQYGNIVNTENTEKTEQDLANYYIEEDDVVFELGARYGSVSCTINSKLKYKTNQVVVEPDERVWEALERNKKVNKCEFHIVKGFVSSKKLGLTALETEYATTSIEDNLSTIPSYTLDEIKEQYNLNFNVLVADCEGFLEQFFDENPTFYDTLRLILFEADYTEKCNYNKIRYTLNQKGFTEILRGHQNVWMKE